MVKKIKQIFSKPKREETNLPMTGGTIFNDSLTLETTQQITLDSMKRDLQHINDRSMCNYYYWYVLNFHCDYFANLFYLEGVEDINLYYAIILTFRMYFYYGASGILVKEGKCIPVYEVESKLKANGEIDWIKVAYSYDIATQPLNRLDREPKNIFMLKGGKLDNYARLIGGMNAFIKWLPFVRLQTELLTMINNHRYFLNKKMLINVNDPSALKTETDLFFDINNPFIVNIDTESVHSNQFVAEGFSGHADVNDLLDYYSFCIKVYYELLGRRINTDYKTERNVAKEVEATQSNFDILTNNEFEYKRLFIEQLNKLLGKSIKISKQSKEEKTEEKKANDLSGMSKPK